MKILSLYVLALYGSVLGLGVYTGGIAAVVIGTLGVCSVPLGIFISRVMRQSKRAAACECNCHGEPTQ